MLTNAWQHCVSIFMHVMGIINTCHVLAGVCQQMLGNLCI